jgi:hypothetical protein
MFTRECKEDTLAEGGMRVVIADAHVIILAWPDNGVIKAFQGGPHTNMPLTEAEFDGTVLTCPSHSWTWNRFCLKGCGCRALQRQQSGMQKFWAGPTIHGSFDSFQSIDLPFRLAIAPMLSDRVSHGVDVPA